MAEEYWHSEQSMPRWVKGLIGSRCSDAARCSSSHNISLAAGLIKVMSDMIAVVSKKQEAIKE